MNQVYEVQFSSFETVKLLEKYIQYCFLIHLVKFINTDEFVNETNQEITCELKTLSPKILIIKSSIKEIS